jgi:hypothetical protein
MILQVASAESLTASRRSTPASVPAAAPAVESSAESPAPAVSSSAQFSTDMKIDDQHQIYYEFVDDRTGNVLFEIPPEALRAIAESLNLSLVGNASAHSVDVKS